MSVRRCFLLLQGVCSPFFAHLANRLQADGHRIVKLNFNGGDLTYWGVRRSRSYRGPAERLQAYLSERCSDLDVSDQILFGDCRPIHRQATAWASTQGIRTHVFEEGYFRPWWVTLELGGVNAQSRLPRDPIWFKTVGARVPDVGDGEPFAAPFHVRARHDVVYHLASAVNPLLFPGYRTHASVTAPVEYAGYLRRFAMLARIERRENARVDKLARGGDEYYLVPLQLNGDAQIQDHSCFRGMQEFIEVVIRSFALHAPANARLVIKNHPLDARLIDYAGFIAQLERRFDVKGRTDYLEAGDLGTLVDHARGVVTVNSTVGSLALRAGRKTIALGKAIYDMSGLTFQGSLDDFWRYATPPDLELYRCFRNTVIHATQVNGGFYSRPGIELATRNATPILTGDRSPLDELL